MKKESNKRKITILVSLFVIGIVALTTASTYAFFKYQKDGSTINTITTGSITFHYQEVDGIGHGISIENALPVSDNAAARTSETPFNFKITSNTSNGVEVPYVITARMDSNSDAVMGDIVDLYLTEVGDPSDIATAIFTSGEVAYNNLNQYNKISNYTEKVIYEGTATGNYEKNFKLRMWIDQYANYAEKCSVSTALTPADCTTAGGTWEYQYNDKEFSVTVNVYAGDTASNTYAANNIGYTPSYAGTTCTGSNATVECALDELNDLLGD